MFYNANWRYIFQKKTKRLPTKIPQRSLPEMFDAKKEQFLQANHFHVDIIGTCFVGMFDFQLGVSKNRGTPKSSSLIGFSLINHPFWGTPIFGNTQLEMIF